MGAYYLYKKDAYNPASPRTPQRIAYQGRVKRNDGGSAGSSADLTFTIYDADTAGSAAWTETQNDVPLGTDGLFSVELGAVNPVYPVDLVPKDLWLSVLVNSEALNPREKLSSSAYALKIESPVPTGGVVLSSTSANADLTAKKFTALAGTIDGYYPFIKSAFSATDPSVPLLINYQGRLLNNAGLPVAATRDLNFSIYDSLAGNTLLWSETITGIALSSGVYDVMLGSGSTIIPDTFPGPNAFLEVKVVQGATVETLSPRQRLTSVPFAMQAEGTLPTTALILGSTVNDPNLTDTGFQMTGDTVNGYYIYGKRDVDITPPGLTIIQPSLFSGYSVESVAANVTYSDDLSGINTSSFEAYLNGDTVMRFFTVGGTGATGNLTAALGENILRVVISDNEGNSRQKLSTFYMDDTGTPPVIDIISPLDGTSVSSCTPMIQVEMYDDEGGLDLSSLVIEVNGVDVTYMFAFDTLGTITTASWQAGPDNCLPIGSNLVTVYAMNWIQDAWQEMSNFWVQSGGTYPEITSISPQFGFAGDTVVINGSNFSGNTVDNQVLFFKKVRARVWQASPTQLTVTVPKAAMSGVIKAVVGTRASISPVPFVIGLKYGFVANNDTTYVPGNTVGVSVIDFDAASPGTWLNKIPCGSKPFDVAVSPNGKTAYVTDNTGNKIYILDPTTAADSDTVRGTINITGPRYVTFSPDGLEVYIGANNGYLYTITNNVIRAGGARLLGNQTNKMAVSPLHQYLYVVQNLGNATWGKINFINIDKANYRLDFSQPVYYKPMGLTLSPDQQRVYVVNNLSEATSVTGSQTWSYSYFYAETGWHVGEFGAQIAPEGSDAHDVNWPLEAIFDPRGRLFYSTFSEGFASSTNNNGTSNNVGAQRPPLDATFEAATNTKRDTPNRMPKGLAFSPGGEFLFAADFGLMAGNSVMIIDHKKALKAIESDAGNGSYNLTGTNPESLEHSSVLGNPGIVRFAGGFDAPRNIAFQQFPIINIYPEVVHLALGGVAPGSNLVRARIHPIYGDTVNVALSGGTVIDLTYTNLQAGFTAQGYRVNTPIFGLTAETDTTTLLQGYTAGIGKILAQVDGYPSNVAFVTVPPQVFVQVLFAEACPNTNEITYRALAGVVKNRTRLTRGGFKKKAWWGTDGQKFDFSPRVGHDPRGAIQVRAENATEKLAANQLRLAFNHGYDCTDPAINKNAYKRYVASAYRKVAQDFPAAQLWNYDMSVIVAGDAMLDLVNTLTNGDTMFNLASHDLIPGNSVYDDPNYMDSYPDPTGGSFYFYSPSNAEWVGIEDALTTETTTFPNTGEFETDTICGPNEDHPGTVFSFCVKDENMIPRAKYIQVVVVRGIPNNYDACGGSLKNQAPQFIFLRFREDTKASVVWGP